jgi:hypothetical protein
MILIGKGFALCGFVGCRRVFRAALFVRVAALLELEELGSWVVLDGKSWCMRLICSSPQCTAVDF